MTVWHRSLVFFSHGLTPLATASDRYLRVGMHMGESSALSAAARAAARAETIGYVCEECESV
jgi:hypothetical protein